MAEILADPLSERSLSTKLQAYAIHRPMHDLDEEGVWQVNGAVEDGPRGDPKGHRDLGTYHGRFGDVIAHALEEDEFFYDPEATEFSPQRDGYVEKIGVQPVDEVEVIDQALEEGFLNGF